MVQPYPIDPEQQPGMMRGLGGLGGMFRGLGRGFQGGANVLNPYSNRLLGFGAGMLGGGGLGAGARGMMVGTALDREAAEDRRRKTALAGLLGDTDPGSILAGLSPATQRYIAEDPEAMRAVLGARLKGQDPTKYGFQSLGGKMFRTNPDTGELEEVYSDPQHGQPTTKDVFDAERQTRNDALSDPQFKRYQEAAPVYQSMVASGGRDDQFADLNLVYGLAKIMDPTSVVREGEQIMVRDASGLTPQLVGYITSLNGGAKLIPSVRQQLLREAKGRMTEYRKAAEQQQKFFRDIAEQNGLDPDRTVPNLPDLSEFVASEDDLIAEPAP